MTIMVTGGSGFIGSALVRHLVLTLGESVLNVDKLTYAGSANSTVAVQGSSRYAFEQADVGNRETMLAIFDQYRPTAIIHLAAESHVDRSIDQPSDFVQANILGSFNLLEVTRLYLKQRPNKEFRFIHVSTDEVFGSLTQDGSFGPDSPYRPTSPYSASKAASDHLVRAWYHTYGLPAIITNCSNNYGPFQNPEKFIPILIISAIQGSPIPIYGHGTNVRDWLFVDDHVRALSLILKSGTVGETYMIGGGVERTNIAVAHSICSILDDLLPRDDCISYSSLIRFVTDRPGHDLRYSVDFSKINRELGWEPMQSFHSGLNLTVEWYLDHTEWCMEQINRGSVPTRRDSI